MNDDEWTQIWSMNMDFVPVELIHHETASLVLISGDNHIWRLTDERKNRNVSFIVDVEQ